MKTPKILLLNPPHTAIGGRVPDEHLPPLGQPAIGGLLIDAGFTVELLDADIDPLSPCEIVRRVAGAAPDILLVGHAGSSAAHPTVVDPATRIKAHLPGIFIVYGGVFPTYYWRDILHACPAIDFIVRGEGERTVPALVRAIALHGAYGRRCPASLSAIRECLSPRACPCRSNISTITGLAGN